jgi:hypothetical protein
LRLLRGSSNYTPFQILIGLCAYLIADGVFAIEIFALSWKCSVLDLTCGATLVTRTLYTLIIWIQKISLMVKPLAEEALNRLIGLLFEVSDPDNKVQVSG